MNNEVFTSLIKHQNASKVLEEYNKKTVLSLQKLLNSASVALSYNMQDIFINLEKINCKSKLKPEMFYFYHKLYVLMANNNAQGVLTLLNNTQLSIFSNSQESISMGSINKSGYQHDALKKVESPENPMLEVNSEKIVYLKKVVKESLSLIKNASADFSSEMDSFVSNVSFFSFKKSSIGIVGMSDVSIFGDIIIRANDTSMDDRAYFIEHLVHETSHQYLHALMEFDPLILNDKEERYPAPIRTDLRPMFGVFHATFVLSRMVYITHLIYNQTGEQCFLDNLNTFKSQFNKGIQVVRNHAVLTDNGKLVVNSYNDLLGDILYESSS
jgi:hypothetical protein